ncbi:unnamed protein product [Sphagnum compactum]
MHFGLDVVYHSKYFYIMCCKCVQNVNFSYGNFDNSTLIPLHDAAKFPDHVVLNLLQGQDKFGVGRILYTEKVQFQDLNSMAFASFSTFFTFGVNSSEGVSGDGLAFIIVADNSSPSDKFSGGQLGLLDPLKDGNASNRVFAVEIDTYQNLEHNDPSNSHVGVDINSLKSFKTCDFCNSCSQSYFATQGKFEAWIDYAANNQTLQVVVQPHNQTGNASIPPFCKIVVPDFTLSNVLANDGYMYVGFSGATGDQYEYHNIYSWSFSTSGLPNQKKKSLLILIVLTCGIIFVGGGILGAICFFKTKPRKGLHVVKLGSHGNQDNYDIDMEEFLGGPRRFSYKELSTATKAFNSTEMLGQTSKTIELTWDLRYNILIGVSSALTYLHEEWEQCVIHRDVKASNVMLDEEFNPRLGDFGLARLIARTKNAQTTIVAGTLGYMAPELSTTGKATTKTDVFSYGAFLLEVACGRRPIDLHESEEKMILLDWVWMCYENGELFKVVDVKLATKFNEEQMNTVLLLGLLCSHPDPNARPTMGGVHQVLTGNVNLPPIPFHKPVASYSTQNGIGFMDVITSSTTNDGEC